MRANAIFFLSTAATSMSVLFIPVIGKELGASNLAIGAVISVYGLMSLASMYVFGWVSDKRGRLALIRSGMLLSTLTFLLQLFASGEAALFVVRALCGFSIGVFYSSLVIYGVESGKKLGKYTSYESLGWGLGNLVAGAIAVYADVFIISSLLFLLSLVLSYTLPDVKAPKVKVPLLPFGLIRRNLNVYAPFLLRDIGAFSIWAFFPLYLYELGASSLWIGIIYFFNTGGQFIFKQFIDRYDNETLFTWGLALSSIAFYAYGLPTYYLHVILMQLIVAAAWSALSVGTMGLLTERNREKATVIGLFSSARSFAQIIGPLLAGVITHIWGFNALMAFSGSITLAGLMLHMAYGNARPIRPSLAPHNIQVEANLGGQP
jgi:MFS family permease